MGMEPIQTDAILKMFGHLHTMDSSDNPGESSENSAQSFIRVVYEKYFFLLFQVSRRNCYLYQVSYSTLFFLILMRSDLRRAFSIFWLWEKVVHIKNLSLVWHLLTSWHGAKPFQFTHLQIMYPQAFVGRSNPWPSMSQHIALHYSATPADSVIFYVVTMAWCENLHWIPYNNISFD